MQPENLTPRRLCPTELAGGSFCRIGWTGFWQHAQKMPERQSTERTPRCNLHGNQKAQHGSVMIKLNLDLTANWHQLAVLVVLRSCQLRNRPVQCERLSSHVCARLRILGPVLLVHGLRWKTITKVPDICKLLLLLDFLWEAKSRQN